MADSRRQRRVLLVCPDVIGKRMTGPGIRYWEFARLLSSNFDVTLAVPPFIRMETPTTQPNFPAKLVACRKAGELRRLVAETDVIVTLGLAPAVYPFLLRTGKPLVIDLYDPFLLEGLHRYAVRPTSERVSLHEGYRRALVQQMRVADFMMCAGEKQRDYWLGLLSALGRINPYTHDRDETMYQLIDIVPFGLPTTPPRHTRQVLKGAYQTIRADDKVIFWGGGIWNWFDAPTLIKAVGIISQQQPNVKLFFMGIKHPNLQASKMKAIEDAIILSKALGLYDRYVFFNDWVPYNERENYLLEADVGVSLHRNHLEGRFAFRTRFLDYLWAGLPIVATEGDTMSDQIREWGLGRVVAPGDVEGVSAAILDLLNTPRLRETYQPRFVEAAAKYRWDVVTAPLVEYCTNPRLAPDRAFMREIGGIGAEETHWWSLPSKAWKAVRIQGINGLLRQTQEYVRWRLGQR